MSTSSALIVGLVALTQAAHADAAERPFTVADSIGMTRLVDPDAAGARWVQPQFKFSPDGRRFLVVTRRGNLSSGYNEFALRLFDADEVRAFVANNASSTLPKQTVLVQFETGAWQGGIVGVRWLPDGDTIAFVGRGPDRIGQVFTVNARSRSVRQLTHHAQDVAAFDIAGRPETVIYAARVLEDWTNRNRHGYAVKSRMARELVLHRAEDAFEQFKYFIARPDRNEAREVNMPPFFVPLDRDLWLSPTGRWAIASAYAHDVPAVWWEAYDSLRELLDDARASTELVPPGEDIFRRESWIRQFLLIDIETGAVKPIVDAPSGNGISATVSEVFWRDGSSAILTDTFLPLADAADDAERQRRRRSPAVVEVDLPSERVTRIADTLVPQSTGKPRAYLIGAAIDSQGEITLSWRAGAGQPVVQRTLAKRGRTWVERKRSAKEGPRFSLSVEQNLNSPPEIQARLAATGRSKVITDFNPDLRSLKLGTVQVFEWHAADQRRWRAGLVLPPDFREGIRYPLVMQTYGFDPSEFLVDGAQGQASAFAARPLGARGMVVMQMPEDGADYGSPNEGPNQLKLLKSAIDALDARGLIDRSRVGLIGFSRTGMHVQYAITFTDDDHPFAAAIICDSIANGYWAYVDLYGTEYPGMLEVERMVGAPFWSDDRSLWLEKSPGFNLHRVHTPLRIERLGTYLSSYWDTFALLKRHRRPVEMIHIADAIHRLDLAQPFARLTSQQGTVDWFDYWLNGREDPNPAKQEQYARWRILREQHEALVPKAHAKPSERPPTADALRR